MGVDRAVLSLPSSAPFSALKGWFIGQAWRGFETYGQVGRGGVGAGVGWGGWVSPGDVASLSLTPGSLARESASWKYVSHPGVVVCMLQVSLRNKTMVQLDWLKTKVWGRVVSEH